MKSTRHQAQSGGCLHSTVGKIHRMCEFLTQQKYINNNYCSGLLIRAKILKVTTCKKRAEFLNLKIFQQF